MTRHQPHLITDAERSQDEQLRSRQVRYATMMGIRVLCLVIAGVLVSVNAPLLWLWLPLCVVGMVLLPWMAVLIANDRLPREQHRLRRFLPGGPRSSDRDLPAPGHRAVSDTEHRVIDADQ